MLMSGAEEEIRALLMDDIVRTIARACRSPQSTSVIIAQVMSIRRSQDRGSYEGIVGDTLVRMEKFGAISYTSAGWKTNEITLSVLKKYFGD